MEDQPCKRAEVLSYKDELILCISTWFYTCSHMYMNVDWTWSRKRQRFQAKGANSREFLLMCMREKSRKHMSKYVCTQKVLVILKTSMQEESASVDSFLQGNAINNNGLSSISFSLWAPICTPSYIHNVYVGSLPKSSFHTLNLHSLYGVYTILRLKVETHCRGGLCKRQRNSCAIHDQQIFM